MFPILAPIFDMFRRQSSNFGVPMALRLARLQRAIASRHLTPKPTPKYSSTQIGHTPIALSTAMLGRFTISTKSVAALAALGAWNQIRTIATGGDSFWSHRERLNNRLKKLGLVEVPVTGDGNCQFRAIAGSLYGDELRHVEVRKNVCDWLQVNGDSPIDKDGTRVSDFLDVANFSDWNEYVNSMKRPGSWGDQLSLFAAANVYDANIMVISSVNAADDEHAITYLKPLNKEPSRRIILSLLHEMHYNYCIPEGKHTAP